MLRNRLLGNVFSKTIRDWLLWTIIAVVAMWLISAMYIGVMASSGDAYVTMMNDFPEALSNIYGQNNGTPEGLAMSGIYFLIGPLVLLTYAIGLGSSAAVGEEEAGSLPILLASPLRRRSILLAKATVAVIGVAIITLLTWVGVVAFAGLLGLDLSDQNVAGASIQLSGHGPPVRRPGPRPERLARFISPRHRRRRRPGGALVLRDDPAASDRGSGRPGQADSLVPLERCRRAEQRRRPHAARHRPRPRRACASPWACTPSIAET